MYLAAHDVPSTRHCILISQLLSFYISKSSTAFYVHRVPNITWAGPSTSAQQKKASLHRNEENIRCVVQQDAKRPALRVPSRGWRFFAQKKSLPPSNKFFIALGFSSFSPGVFFVISKGGAEEPSRLRAHKPLPHTFIQYPR